MKTEFISPRVGFSRFDAQNKETKATMWGLNGSASIKGKTVTITAVNPDHLNARETEINLHGAKIVSADARVLSSNNLQIRNTLANPNAIEPRNEAVSVGAGGSLVYKFAPASVTTIDLANCLIVYEKGISSNADFTVCCFNNGSRKVCK